MAGALMHWTDKEKNVFLDLINELYIEYLCDPSQDKKVTENKWMNEHQILNLTMTLLFHIHSFAFPCAYF